ncbi:hypothetical protein ACTXGU_05120 [Niallia sp. 01092]
MGASSEIAQNMDILNRKIEFHGDQLKGNTYKFVLYPNEEENS